MNINIDPSSGFCYGVKKAIKTAEQYLELNDSLLCLGEIVHNQEEIDRLSKLGLRIIDHDQVKQSGGKKVLIRAHGEPPDTYVLAEKMNAEIIDATCPVVGKLQKKVKKAYEEVNKLGGQIIITGKKGHPEVIGLNGQIENRAIIIEYADDPQLSSLDYSKPVRLFSQTTFSADTLKKIVLKIEQNLIKANPKTDMFKVERTLCSYVSGRIPRLKEFSSRNDVVIFVSGKNSSNGKQLFEICKSVNSQSYIITSDKEINTEWFRGAKNVGISGATSTPQWLIEKVAAAISLT